MNQDLKNTLMGTLVVVVPTELIELSVECLLWEENCVMILRAKEIKYKSWSLPMESLLSGWEINRSMQEMCSSTQL